MTKKGGGGGGHLKKKRQVNGTSIAIKLELWSVSKCLITCFLQEELTDSDTQGFLFAQHGWLHCGTFLKKNICEFLTMADSVFLQWHMVKFIQFTSCLCSVLLFALLRQKEIYCCNLGLHLQSAAGQSLREYCDEFVYCSVEGTEFLYYSLNVFFVNIICIVFMVFFFSVIMFSCIWRFRHLYTVDGYLFQTDTVTVNMIAKSYHSLWSNCKQ